MRVANILSNSTVDGDGLRSVVFFQGCSNKCVGCHNPTSWDFNGGNEMSIEEILNVIKLHPLDNVTFSGGNPIEQPMDELTELAKEIKKIGKTIWLYTGNTYEDIQHLPVFEYIDVVVDGRFEIEKRDLTLAFRGSSNQRIIRLNEYQEIRNES